MILERDIEAYLVARVKELGGEIRKVQWVGRDNAPDRVVMLPWRYGLVTTTIWVEVKNPRTVANFPCNAHERAQQREHQRMRECGQHVEVVGTYDQVDALLK